VELPEEIKNAAQALGKSLHADDFLRAYLEAVEAFRADLEARQLEEQLYATYNALIARQGAGEQLSREETQDFYDLRRQVQADPAISKRDNELRLIKPHLAEIADEINAPLGVDFTTLAG
jgi:cell fate (sporulation/competence/biofilm development) regulator YlbF (YheA/YmcA/DUF963 family)